MSRTRLKLLLVPLVFCLSIAALLWRVHHSGLHPCGDNDTCYTSVDAAFLDNPIVSLTQKSPCVRAADAPPLPFDQWLQYKNYTRTYIRPQFVESSREFSSLSSISQHVLTPFEAMGRGHRKSKPNRIPTCAPIVDLEVTADPSNEDTAGFLFGIATSLDRLERMLPSLIYSFGDTKASLIVVLEESNEDIAAREAHFRSRGLDVTLTQSSLEYTSRYFSLTKVFKEHIQLNRRHTKWVAFMDDDTLFLSLPSLAQDLVRLDHTQKHYIGQVSEARWQVDALGKYAFGGASVFISVPLLDVLYEKYNSCASWDLGFGDLRLARCIEKYGGTSFTTWDSLYQMDTSGPIDGIFESGRRIDTLHHWDSWYHHDVMKMTSVAAVAGRRSVLRRWMFDRTRKTTNLLTGSAIREFWVLTNGFSIAKYTIDQNTPDDRIDFDKVEHTWREDINGFKDRFGEMRENNENGVTKTRWYLKDAVIIDGNVHQVYAGGSDKDGHSVIELVWLGEESSEIEGDRNKQREEPSVNDLLNVDVDVGIQGT